METKHIPELNLNLKPYADGILIFQKTEGTVEVCFFTLEDVQKMWTLTYEMLEEGVPTIRENVFHSSHGLSCGYWSDTIEILRKDTSTYASYTLDELEAIHAFAKEIEGC